MDLDAANPLAYPVFYDRVPIVRDLLERGADVHRNNGEALRICLQYRRSQQMLSLLLQYYGGVVPATQKWM